MQKPPKRTNEANGKPAARGWYHPGAFMESLALRPRVYLAAIGGALAFFACPSTMPGTVRASISWDVAGLIYLLIAFRLMYNCDAAHIQKVAAARDDSRLVILTLTLLAIGASFAAIAQLIVHAKQPSIDSGEKIAIAAIAMLTIIISWCVTHSAFALHYAHEYYRPGRGSDAQGGLKFPGCDTPDYWDFLYFSVSIGAASQTSDTLISSRNLRRLVTVHSVIAFFFNTAVLALTVNTAASLAQG
jgi:uncharacterized membrane protein